MTNLNVISAFIVVSLHHCIILTSTYNPVIHQSSKTSISKRCLDVNFSNIVEKCHLCQKKKTGNSNCFPEGVHYEFFQCTDDNYGIDCDLKNNATVLENYVSVKGLRENQTCYFDLTNGKNDSFHRARFYLTKSISCSNSSNFIIDPGTIPDTYRVTVSASFIPGNSKILVLNTKYSKQYIRLKVTFEYFNLH